jgi:hypothetical protein
MLSLLLPAVVRPLKSFSAAPLVNQSSALACTPPPKPEQRRISALHVFYTRQVGTSHPDRRRPSSARRLAYAAALVIARTALAAGIAALLLLPAEATGPSGEGPRSKTPIEHLVVIFQENHSFDAYFATYPLALNPPGQPTFRARPGTPSVNGLTPALIK